jgi:Aerotolerance regulator N-terminal/von Willebrand factor type A domain
MPLSFANPALLFGALAAALPVIIHLISRRKVRRQQFSDLRFLDEVQSHQSRSLGIKRWLLLLLRVLALLCIALAVAQPRWGGLAASGRGARSVLFVIDASASMKSEFEGETRFGVAKQTAAGMIRSLPENTSVQVVTAGAGVTALFGDWLPAKVAGGGTLQDLECTDGSMELTDVLREAARQVSRAPGSPVEIVLISDLQAVDESPGLAEAVGRLQRSGAVHLLVRKIGDRVEGGGILDLTFPGRAILPGENITLTATVSTQFAEEVFWLDLDGRTVAETAVESSPDSAGADFRGAVRRISFPLTVPASGLHTGRVRKQSDAGPADDVRPFVLKVSTALDVLLVHGADRSVDGAPGRGGWRYLAQALQPGGQSGAFRVSAIPAGDLTTGALGNSDVAVFVNPGPLGRQALAGLSGWLEAGGSALFLVGEPTQKAYLETTLLPLLNLPGEAIWTVPERGDGQRVRVVDGSHPVFEGLEAAAMATFAEVRSFRWFHIDEGDQRVLLSLTGDDALLIEGRMGEGSYALMPMDLLPAATDLAANPMALPFFQRLVALLANRSRLTDAVNVRVGEEAVIRPSGSSAAVSLENADELLVRREGFPTADSAHLVWLAGEPVLSGGATHRAGLVTFLAGGDTVGVVAAGTPAEESTLDLYTQADWSEMLGRNGLPVTGDLTDVHPTEWMSALEGTDLVVWFLALAALLLCIESVLGRGARAGAPRGSPS